MCGGGGGGGGGEVGVFVYMCVNMIHLIHSLMDHEINSRWYIEVHKFVYPSTCRVSEGLAYTRRIMLCFKAINKYVKL